MNKQIVREAINIVTTSIFVVTLMLAFSSVILGHVAFYVAPTEEIWMTLYHIVSATGCWLMAVSGGALIFRFGFDAGVWSSQKELDTSLLTGDDEN